jgi:hypothetical protein
MKKIKQSIIDLVIETINLQIANVEASKKEAEDESKFHKGAMASRYDTFKEEAQTLVDSYNGQLNILGRQLSSLRSLKNKPPHVVKGSVYAIIELRDEAEDQTVKYFLLPAGGGVSYTIDGETFTVLNVMTPVARPLIGAAAGDRVQVTINKINKTFHIISIT